MDDTNDTNELNTHDSFDYGFFCGIGSLTAENWTLKQHNIILGQMVQGRQVNIIPSANVQPGQMLIPVQQAEADMKNAYLDGVEDASNSFNRLLEMLTAANGLDSILKTLDAIFARATGKTLIAELYALAAVLSGENDLSRIVGALSDAVGYLTSITQKHFKTTGIKGIAPEKIESWSKHIEALQALINMLAKQPDVDTRSKAFTEIEGRMKQLAAERAKTDLTTRTLLSRVITVGRKVDATNKAVFELAEQVKAERKLSDKQVKGVLLARLRQHEDVRNAINKVPGHEETLNVQMYRMIAALDLVEWSKFMRNMRYGSNSRMS